MTTWRKSSRSGAGGTGECVELARLAEAVGVRDSKNPTGGHLTLDATQYADLVAKIKTNALDR